MLTRSLIAATMAIGLASSAAIDSASIHQRGVKAYDWKNPDAKGKGNIGIGFGDNTVRTGTVSPDSLVHGLKKYCLKGNEGACIFDVYSQDGSDIEGTSGKAPITVTVHHEQASFAPGDGATLIDALGAAVAKATKTEEVCDVCGCEEDYCFQGGKEKKLTMHYTPDVWAITVPDPKDPEGKAPIDIIQVSVSSAVQDSGFCSSFSSIGSTVAGAVGAVAPEAGAVTAGLSAGLSLLGLFCSA